MYENISEPVKTYQQTVYGALLFHNIRNGTQNFNFIANDAFSLFENKKGQYADNTFLDGDIQNF